MEELTWTFEQTGGPESAESNNAIDEVAVQRVREDSQKAQQIAQKAKKDRKKNMKFAKFLTFLLKTIQDENLMASIYHVFFKTKHPKTQTTFLRKNINTVVVCGIFAPFYQDQVQQFGLAETFATIYDYSTPITLQKYLHYLKKLSQTHHDNIPIDKWDFINFLINIIIYYKLDNLALHNAEERTKVFGLLEKELFS